jgi:branched-chain amino acid transport system ATP-binding protein
MPLLELRKVSVGYARTTVLEQVSIHLDEGEIVTLVGANGAGKSTIAKTVSGIVRPLSGDVLLDGKSVAGMTAAQRLRLGVAHVPEGRQIFSGMSVSENLMLGAHSLAATDQTAFQERMEFVCRLFPVLKPRLSDIAGNFSGGQQQMLAIARGLMSKPRLLVLDEPSLGVAPLLVAEIFELIKKLRDQGISILLAEQNARQALGIADRGYVLENGAISISGPAATLAASPDIAERYLGVGTGASVSSERSDRMAARLTIAIS